MAAIHLPIKKVRLWSQVAITFFIVSGGPYGLESSVGAVGAGWTFFLVLLVPLIWALPTTLMVSELSSMMPKQGGYYVWVREALGRFWGFQEGWWTICYSVVDLAIYPILFVTYLSYFWPELANVQNPTMMHTRWTICAGFVLCGVLMNLRGSHWVGVNKIIEMVLVAFPFIILVTWGFSSGDWQNLHLAIGEVLEGHRALEPAQIAAGLAIVLWNFTGWDNATTYANEIENPHLTIPKSMLITLPLVVLFYLLPLIFGFKASIDPKVWAGDSSGWPEITSRLIGPVIGSVTAIAAVISAWALFNSQLLYIARLPAAMAGDSALPKILAKESKNSSVPTVSLFIAGTIAAIFCGFSLGKLIVVDILLYSLGLGLEFIALIVLRFQRPDLERPYRIPIGKFWIILMSLLPMMIAVTVAISSVMGESGSYLQISIAAGAALSGPLIYHSMNRKKRS